MSDVCVDMVPIATVTDLDREAATVTIKLRTPVDMCAFERGQVVRVVCAPGSIVVCAPGSIERGLYVEQVAT